MLMLLRVDVSRYDCHALKSMGLLPSGIPVARCCLTIAFNEGRLRFLFWKKNLVSADERLRINSLAERWPSFTHGTGTVMTVARRTSPRWPASWGAGGKRVVSFTWQFSLSDETANRGASYYRDICLLRIGLEPAAYLTQATEWSSRGNDSS